MQDVRIWDIQDRTARAAASRPWVVRWKVDGAERSLHDWVREWLARCHRWLQQWSPRLELSRGLKGQLLEDVGSRLGPGRDVRAQLARRLFGEAVEPLHHLGNEPVPEEVRQVRAGLATGTAPRRHARSPTTS